MILLCNILFLFTSICCKTAWTSMVSMKIVEAPVSYGLNNDVMGTNFNQDSLTLLVPPSKFSGPPHFTSLLGRCFNFTDDNYIYTFCPFHNITQFESTNRWNSYQGILGVWQEWKIINNTFSSMMMLKGDKCGDIYRSVEIILACNDTEGIQQVAEPFKCTYVLIFATPLVCHPDALLVYPHLSESLRRKWDQLETDLNLEFISHEGYESELQDIFIEAGYQQNKDIKLEEKKSEIDSNSKHSHTNLNDCLKEVEELRNEIEGLKILLDLRAIPHSLREKNIPGNLRN